MINVASLVPAAVRSWLLVITAFAAGAWATSSGLVGEILYRWGDIVYLSNQHMQLVVISGGAAIVLGVPFGILLSRPSMQNVAETLMQVLNIGTTIPTLAVLALSMSLLGIGTAPAIFALWVASLLPIVRNTYIGILEVPSALREAAHGMGMTSSQMLLKVELPNALWVIFAGIRTALAINVGTVPLAFLIGGGGLGELIFTGIALANTGMMLAGAIPTAILAVITDFVIATVARITVPRGVNPLAA